MIWSCFCWEKQHHNIWGPDIMALVYIGENCDIGPNSFLRKYSSLGDNVSVGNGVEIKNSIIMDDTNVNHLTYVGDSIIGFRNAI